MSLLRRDKDSDDDEFDAEMILRDPIVLTADVQLFLEPYRHPTVAENGVLVTLPPHGDKPWRIEMTTDMLEKGGVARTLRMSRRGVMFFCDGDVVEQSINIQPVTMLEAVYESSVWEPADGFMALETAPLDRNGHAPDKPVLLLIMRMPTEKQRLFETFAVLFSKCTKRSARRYRDAKPISIVARQVYQNEALKYAARLVEEEEARKEAAAAGGGTATPQAQPVAKPDEFDAPGASGKKPEPLEPLDASVVNKSDDGDSTSPASLALLSPGGDQGLEPEVETIICINPFVHELIHVPEKFDSEQDGAELTALDAAHLRRLPDRDTDAQLYTKTRALYFGSQKDDRSSAAVDALTAMLQRGRELAALGKPRLGGPASAEGEEEGAGDGATAAVAAAGATDAPKSHGLGDSPEVSPARHKSFLEAFSYRETTRVQSAHLHAFFADAEAERRERQALETVRLSALLRDAKIMSTTIGNTYKLCRENQLSGMAAPRRRTPPWVRADPPPAKPSTSSGKMQINTDDTGRIVNPFSYIGRSRK